MNNEILEKLERRLKGIDETLKDISLTLARQEEQLRYHIRRTDLLENKMGPIEAFNYKIMGGLGVVGGIIAVLKLLGKL